MRRTTRSSWTSIFHLHKGARQIYSASELFSLTFLLSLLLLTLSCGSGASGNSAKSQPSFTVTASPNTMSIQQGSTGTATIKIHATGGFSGTVTLAAANLPAGVTASFSPSSTSSTSTLTFTASSSAATGNISVSVTGTSGSLSASAAIAFNAFVPPPPGSVPASFFALNNVEPTDNPLDDGMSYGGIGHPIRLAWPYIETTRGVYDFSFYDQYAAIAPKDANGVALMDLTLGMTPTWAVSNQSAALCRSLAGGVNGCEGPPDNIQDWADFITALIQHYNGVTAPHIKYYEIWNEWNVNDDTNGFWSGTAAQLVTLAKAAYPIIHQDAFSQVVTPSTVGPATSAGDSAPSQLAAYLQAGGSTYADAVSFHGNLGLMTLTPFPLPGEGCNISGCNGTIVEIANSYRQIANTSGLQNIPLLDTEGGFESANITDNDQRTAWLAQFYALQGGLFNSDQLQWVSWFTWGAPGVAGNIESSNQTPDEAGVAYNQLYNWLFGRLPSVCTKSASVWTCALTGATGYQAEILWDDSQTCKNGSCTTSVQTPPTWAVQYRDLTGKANSITGSTISIGLKPVILENQ